MAIDNPIDKIRAIAPPENEDTLFGSLIALGANFEPITAIASTVKSIFDNQEQWNRVWTALLALCNELETQRAELPGNAAEMLQRPWFKDAVRILIEEAARSSTTERAKYLAEALARGCFPLESHKHRQENLASYIYDLARLGEDDLQMLKLLYSVYKEVIHTAPNLDDPNSFTERFGEFKRMRDARQMHQDDSIALCARLAGFGLACEVTRNTSRQTPGEHCYRPTRRGLYLLWLVGAADLPIF